ncbi:hypothetical protein [Paenibacillus cucumis (ex Kampfer et al. 2016)]|uniref:Cell wall hydrolase SleB domain-containing protein n=1 Tax=Paenibacillus cucumis (ex Kampfer et al. 2016) TaxID=1776858 RepID=A0ABS7KF17_9BACL|nr:MULTISPECIES: hypothetical protein [Paenibacillus]MBY0202686.1 hypothetical protein [Paenibacillus cucumis (ex Kampfer et al. 2016)]
MKKTLNKSIIASLLAFVMTFSLAFQAHAQETRVSNFSSESQSDITILIDNEEKMVVSATIPAITPNNSFAKINALTSEYDVTTDITGTMTIDKNVKSMTLVTNEKSEISSANQRTYDVNIHEINSLGDIHATFTDLETNQTYTIEQDKFQASFAIQLGIIVGEKVIAGLLAIGAILIVTNETWASVIEIRETLRQKNHEYYQANIMGGQLYVGPAIDLASASARLINPMFSAAAQNVWSTTRLGAERVARTAGGGVTPVGPELNVDKIPGFYYYAHYHTWNRVGGHSFF